MLAAATGYWKLGVVTITASCSQRVFEDGAVILRLCLYDNIWSRYDRSKTRFSAHTFCSTYVLISPKAHSLHSFIFRYIRTLVLTYANIGLHNAVTSAVQANMG